MLRRSTSSRWVFYIFGAFLIYTAVKLASEGESDDDEYEENRFMKWVERRFPATKEYDGTKLFSHENGKRLATPMFIVILALGTTDLLFALDSIPAIYGLTKEPYLVLTANIFALMGLRQLYFLIGGLLKRLVYLSIGLAVLLAFIGVKLILHALHANELPFINGGEHVTVPGDPDLGCRWAPSCCILGVTTVASLMKTRRDERDGGCVRRPSCADPGQAPVDVAPGPCGCAGARAPGRWPATTQAHARAAAVGVRRWPSTTSPASAATAGSRLSRMPNTLALQAAQREQLERVGQHRGQHRDAERP